jgi:hypothetical protein
MNALITTIVLWLSANFGLPATQEHPRVEFVRPEKIVELRYKGLGNVQQNTTAAVSDRREPVAVYLDTTKTIYLRDDWSGASSGEVSVLVHELVHHLQNVGKLTFECPQEREQLAYKAQEKWLSLFGTDLRREFDVDPFTLFVASKCFF